MKTDRELLELAAKAAGIEFKWREGDSKWEPEHVGPAAWINGCWQVWNPLTEDGDALRLANKLLIEIRHVNGKVHAGYVNKFWRTENWFPDGDINQATRLAISRAAAAIGEAMP